MRGVGQIHEMGKLRAFASLQDQLCDGMEKSQPSSFWVLVTTHVPNWGQWSQVGPFQAASSKRLSVKCLLCAWHHSGHLGDFKSGMSSLPCVDGICDMFAGIECRAYGTCGSRYL